MLLSTSECLKKRDENAKEKKKTPCVFFKQTWKVIFLVLWHEVFSFEFFCYFYGFHFLIPLRFIQSLIINHSSSIIFKIHFYATKQKTKYFIHRFDLFPHNRKKKHHVFIFQLNCFPLIFFLINFILFRKILSEPFSFCYHFDLKFFFMTNLRCVWILEKDKKQQNAFFLPKSVWKTQSFFVKLSNEYFFLICTISEITINRKTEYWENHQNKQFEIVKDIFRFHFWFQILFQLSWFPYWTHFDSSNGKQSKKKLRLQPATLSRNSTKVD